MMTREEISKRLGLAHWRVFSTQQIHKRSSPESLAPIALDRTHEYIWRCTGRTTKVMVDAMVELSKGKTVICRADTKKMSAYMTDMGRSMAVELGLDPKKVKDGYADCFVARDHMAP